MAEKEERTLEILRRVTVETMGPKLQPQKLIYVTYRDPAGRIGRITLPEKKSTDKEIAKAIRARMKMATETLTRWLGP